MTSESCSTCRYWFRLESIQKDIGACRRFPPVPVAWTEDNEGCFDDRQPGSTALDWCGEYKKVPTLDDLLK